MKIKSNSVFIIAEAGVNHNGSLRLAKKMVDHAKISGADAIKFQTFKAEDVVIKSAEMAEYQKRNLKKKEKQINMLKNLELSEREFIELKKYCDKKKIIFLSTPHTERAVDFLEPLVKMYKIASGDLTNLPFLVKVAKKKKLMIVSTGMANLEEIDEAIKTIKKNGNNKIILLHCTTNYPCPIEEVNLRAMSAIEHKFDLPVGYSDHTQGILVPIMAVAMGAKIIEKHFTLDKNMQGPDHKASLNPEELKDLVENVRKAEKIFGNGIKKPTKSEEKIKKLVRKSIVAKENILKGQKISFKNITFKRPGIGISPKFINTLIGKTAKKDILIDKLISWSDIQKHGY